MRVARQDDHGISVRVFSTAPRRVSMESSRASIAVLGAVLASRAAFRPESVGAKARFDFH
jgi:hypothetical protein